MVKIEKCDGGFYADGVYISEVVVEAGKVLLLHGHKVLAIKLMRHSTHNVLGLREGKYFADAIEAGAKYVSQVNWVLGPGIDFS